MSVSPSRRAAYEVLRRVFEHEAWADRAFPAAAKRHDLDTRDRGQAMRLAYGAVQRRGTTDWITSKLARGRLDPAVVAALRLGLFEILYSDDGGRHAAVSDAVELAKAGMRGGGPRRAAGAAGLVNAVLRRASDEGRALLDGLDDADPSGAAIIHSVPKWMAEMWWRELGPVQARSLLGAVNDPAETAMRVNTLKSDPEELRSRLEREGEPIAAPGTGPLWPAGAITWAGPLGDAALDALARGEMFAQSRAAQAVVAMVGAEPGERILDLCAGPGVKTTALAAAVGAEGEVVAVEIDAGRARQVEEFAGRAGATNVRVVIADAATARMGEEFDRVLVDPPCSDLGTLAAHPDARWRKDPETIVRLAALSRRILENGVSHARAGGTVVFSTCTISRRENQDVAGQLADDTLETRPDRDGTDGFYAARITTSTSGIFGAGE